MDPESYQDLPQQQEQRPPRPRDPFRELATRRAMYRLASQFCLLLLLLWFFEFVLYFLPFFFIGFGFSFHFLALLLAGLFGVVAMFFSRCNIAASLVAVGSFFIQLPYIGWKILGGMLLLVGIIDVFVHWNAYHPRRRL